MVVKCNYCGREIDKEILDAQQHNTCPFCGGNIDYQSIQKEYDFKEKEILSEERKAAHRSNNKTVLAFVLIAAAAIALTLGIHFLVTKGLGSVARPGRPNYESNKNYAGYYLYEDTYYRMSELGRWFEYTPETDRWYPYNSETPDWVMEIWDITKYSSSEMDFSKAYPEGRTYKQYADDELKEKYGN